MAVRYEVVTIDLATMAVGNIDQAACADAVSDEDQVRALNGDA